MLTWGPCVDLSSPNWKRNGTGWTAGELWQIGTPNEMEVGKWDSAGFLPTQSCEILRVGFNSWSAPNLNIFWRLSWPNFGFGSGCPENLKILSLSGLSWLEAGITFALRNTLGFLSPWRSLSLIGWRNRFCNSRYSISQLALKAGSSVACAFEGLANSEAKLLRSRVVKYLDMPWYCHTKHVFKTSGENIRVSSHNIVS